MKVSHLLSGYRLVLEKMNWDAAKEHCQDLGGRLADIKSQEEEEFVERFVSGVNNQLWLGATDRKVKELFSGKTEQVFRTPMSNGEKTSRTILKIWNTVWYFRILRQVPSSGVGMTENAMLNIPVYVNKKP